MLLPLFKGTIMIIMVAQLWQPIYFRKFPPIGLLNCILAGLSNPGPIDVYLIYNKARFIP